ncbi:MAG TPA: hypothetical protein VNV66_19000 [Pilimelia sp.]|nr:hypothetical protein [Pilimelia sp.]
MYARALRLRHLAPGGLLCFLYFEGTLVLGALLLLAELVPWWGILVLPATVAVMVKANDLLAGALAGSGGGAESAGGPAGARGAGPGRSTRPAYSGRRPAAGASSTVDTRAGSAPPASGPEGEWPTRPHGSTAVGGHPVNAPAAQEPGEPHAASRVSRQRMEPWLDPTEQWFRQSASRRYE